MRISYRPIHDLGHGFRNANEISGLLHDDQAIAGSERSRQILVHGDEPVSTVRNDLTHRQRAEYFSPIR